MTSYVPTRSSVATYTPLSLVVSTRSALVSTFRRVTEAPARMAPVALILHDAADDAGRGLGLTREAGGQEREREAEQGEHRADRTGHEHGRMSFHTAMGMGPTYARAAPGRS